MKKLTILQSVVVVSGLLVLTTFQNCSKIQATDLQSATSAKVSGAGDVVPVVSSDSNPGVMPPSSMTPTPPWAKPPGTSSSTPVCDKFDWRKSGDDDKDDDDNDSDHCGKAKCVPRAVDLVAACNNGAAAEISGKMDVTGLNGSYIVDVGPAMGSITDTRGALIARGSGQLKSHIMKIVDVRGSLIVCNLQADSIENTRGNIILVNSKIKSLTNHRGSVFLYASTVDSSSDVTGQVMPMK